MRRVGRLWASVRRAGRPGFARSVAILSSGTILAYSLSVITVPIVSRLYGPQDFGEYALISSFGAVVAALISLGMQSAIVQAKTKEDGQRILTVGLLAGAVLATIIVAVGLALGPVVRIVDTHFPHTMAFVLVWLLGFLTCANGSLRSYANRCGANRVMFTNSLIGSAATLLITLPLGFLGAGAIGLIAGSVGALVVGNAQMVVRLRPLYRRLEPADVRTVFRDNRDFVALQYPANLVETFSTQAPRQVLSVFFGNSAVGVFAMTDRMLGIPVGLIGAPVGTVYFREASQRSAAGENLTPFTMKLVVTIMAVAYFPILGLVVWGEQLFAWLLGVEWAGAGALASVMVIQYLFALTRACVGTARVVLGRQSTNLLMSVLRVLIEVGVLVAGSLVTQNALDTLTAFAVASTLFYILDMSVTFHAIGRSHWKYLAGALTYFASVACIWVLSQTQ